MVRNIRECTQVQFDASISVHSAILFVLHLLVCAWYYMCMCSSFFHDCIICDVNCAEHNIYYVVYVVFEDVCCSLLL